MLRELPVDNRFSPWHAQRIGSHFYFTQPTAIETPLGKFVVFERVLNIPREGDYPAIIVAGYYAGSNNNGGEEAILVDIMPKKYSKRREIASYFADETGYKTVEIW